jgi:Carboxypeptidase regulatory-like domain/Secretion system C-terminal sorting domain
MKKVTLFFLVLLSFSLAFAQDFEGFENGNFLSYNWHFNGPSAWQANFAHPYEGVYSAKTGDIANNEFTDLYISIEVVSEGDISFYWKIDSELDNDYLKFYVDYVEIGGISGDVDWTLFEHTISTGYHTLLWKYYKNDLTTTGLDSGWIDNITFPQTTTFSNDLAAKSIQGPTTVYQESSNIYDIKIKNYGTSSQDNYTVRLFREGGILLDELNVNELLLSEKEYMHQLVWIVPPDEPTATTYVYAEVELAGDEDLSNNTTQDYNLNIYEIGLAQITVGSENESTNWYPFKFHMNYSLAETIYFPNEIFYSGIIHAIGYPKHFVSNIIDTPIQIHMGEVGQSSLASGWIGASALEEVFNGTVDIGSGYGTLIIPFDEPYPYNGGNLCVLNFHQYDGNSYSTNDKFIETITTPHDDRTLALGSTTSLNPNAPPNEGYLFSRYPNTIFYMEITNLGNLEGTVYDGMGNEITTADVLVQQFFTSTVTNGAGYYRFGNIVEGTYNVIASKTGYETQTQTGIIVANDTIVLDFTLTPLPEVQVYGQITGSDEPTIGLENAEIYIFGEFDYQTVSDADGIFDFPQVYANQDYTLAISHYGYDTIWQSVTVEGNDLDLGTIVMQETALLPSGLYAEQDLQGTELTLSWTPQNSFNREFESYEIFRFLESEVNNPIYWVSLDATVTDTSYVDTEWAIIPPSIYQYALRTLYSNSVVSDTIFSNVIEKATGSENNLPIKPTALQSIHPNPFNPQTAISYYLSDESMVEIAIYNVKGQLVKILVKDTLEGGNHTVIWNGHDANNKQQSSGMYFVQMQANKQKINVQKCVLMK